MQLIIAATMAAVVAAISCSDERTVYGMQYVSHLNTIEDVDVPSVCFVSSQLHVACS